MEPKIGILIIQVLKLRSVGMQGLWGRTSRLSSLERFAPGLVFRKVLIIPVSVWGPEGDPPAELPTQKDMGRGSDPLDVAG